MPRLSLRRIRYLPKISDGAIEPVLSDAAPLLACVYFEGAANGARPAPVRPRAPHPTLLRLRTKALPLSQFASAQHVAVLACAWWHAGLAIRAVFANLLPKNLRPPQRQR